MKTRFAKSQWLILGALSAAVMFVYLCGGCFALSMLTAPATSRVAAGPTLVITATPEILPSTIPQPSPTLTPPPTPTSKPLATSTISTIIVDLPTTLPTVNPVQARIAAQVRRVIDGDTIEVVMNGKVYTVRYIGMDTPETVAPGTPVQWMGSEATAANKKLVENKTVYLEKDVSETDRYGRLLRYVYVNALFVNAELVRQGYAQVSTYPPDVKYQSLFLQMQQEARNSGRGLWGNKPATKVPTKVPTLVKTLAPAVVISTAVPSTGKQELVSLTSPIAHGANATIKVRTSPGTSCSITVYYKSGASEAQGLGPMIAGSDGLCSWTWKVGTRTTPGTWSIVVTTGTTTRDYPFVVQ